MKISKYQWGSSIEGWSSQWKDRLQPSARSKVLQKWNASGKKPKPESSTEYTKRRIKEETKRTWRSDAADIAHGIGEGVLALHPYTAIPYYGAKVGQDVLNGNVNWSTALNASIPLFHLSPQAVGLREATNVALEDAANAGSKTARNWRIAREINGGIKQNTKNSYIEVPYSYFEDPNSAYRATTTREVRDLGEVGHTRLASESKLADADYTQGMQGWLKGTNYMKEVENSDNPFTKIKHRNLLTKDGVILETRGTGRQFRKGYHGSSGELQRFEDIDVSVPELTYDKMFGWGYRNGNGFSFSPFTFKGIGLKVGDPNIPAQEISWFTRSKTPGRWTYNGEVIPEKRIIYEPPTKDFSTSLKFFERKPSRISFAERLGVSKGDRNQPFKQKQPTEHIQGEEAVKMFKEYGGTPIPEGSINGEQLRKYVAEARERYGLVGNNNVTDEEIAQALYKHSKELGRNTAAVNAQGEPQLLFRGDTQRYTQLKKRMSPEELAKKSGTMDNSLGNLFLGEFPDSWRGVDRYIGTWRNFNGSPKLVGSGTGSKVVWDGKTASEIEGYPYLGPQAGGGYKLYSQPHRYGSIDVYKLPASMMESGVNDLNAFIVRTPQMRNASSEISVLNDDWMLQGAKDSHFMSKNYKYNPKTYSMENVKTGESLGEITTESAPESRAAMGDHYKELLKEAKQKQQGLLKSEANTPLRDEHSQYSYFVLPNFNIQGAKHLLPYDLRIPRNWKDKNIYRGLIPLTTGYTLYNIFNQPQLQYQRQGGKMNTLQFLKNGSGIHIKKKNRGKFTDYCGGKVTDSCIRRAKASGNPTLVKRATFAANARKWKH